MSRIRAKDTKPELIVRAIVHQLGYRPQQHRADILGKPDFVWPRRRKLIFVHGCFWHMHSCRFGKVKPASNSEFWEAKREGNVRRDRRTVAALKRTRWEVLIIWECQTRKPEDLGSKLLKFLIC